MSFPTAGSRAATSRLGATSISPTIRPCAAFRISPPLWEEEIVERYRYAADGTVTVAIENRTRGYAQNFVLGAPGLG